VQGLFPADSGNSVQINARLALHFSGEVSMIEM
jgi:hypothetical protein